MVNSYQLLNITISILTVILVTICIIAIINYRKKSTENIFESQDHGIDQINAEIKKIAEYIKNLNIKDEKLNEQLEELEKLEIDKNIQNDHKEKQLEEKLSNIFSKILNIIDTKTNKNEKHRLLEMKKGLLDALKHIH